MKQQYEIEGCWKGTDIMVDWHCDGDNAAYTVTATTCATPTAHDTVTYTQKTTGEIPCTKGELFALLTLMVTGSAPPDLDDCLQAVLPILPKDRDLWPIL